MLCFLLFFFKYCADCSELWECPAGFERCSGSRQCIRDYHFCNNVEDCDVGTDEDETFCGKLENHSCIGVATRSLDAEFTEMMYIKYKYKYNSYFYCAPYSLTDDALQKSANTCFTAVGRLK